MTGTTGTLFFRTNKHLKKYKFIAVDIETYGDENLFFMGGIWDENGYRAFYTRQHLMHYLLQYRPNTYIVATNLQFDFNALFYATNLYSEFKIIMRGSDFISCNWKNVHGKKITFIDTFNYAPFSVALMGKILGIPKGESPKCLGRKPENKEEKQELEDYNKRDCEITYKFSQLLQDGFNELGGSMKLTIASTSLDIYLRKYLRFNLLKEPDNIPIDVNDFIFKGYAGGRTEVFSRGKYSNIKCFDANSLYPFSMLGKYPLPASAVYTKHATEDVLKYMGISKCLVEVPKGIKYPFLWKRHDDKLLFPTGTFSGYYTHEEILKAREIGCKIILIETLYYKKTWYPFREYVKDLYAKRMEYKKKNDAREYVMKICLNSLYGKFFQREQTKFNFFDMKMHNSNAEEMWRSEEKVFFNPHSEVGYTIETEICTSSFVTPILSCYTTAKARIYMYDFIVEGNALYTDTDSLFTMSDLPTSKEIGGMKVEYDAKEVMFVKPKMYGVTFNDGTHKIRLKGVPRASKEQFEDILKGDKVTYMKFSKTKSSLRYNKKPNTKEDVVKDISLEDTKRVWEYEFDGTPQESTPIHLSDVDVIE